MFVIFNENYITVTFSDGVTNTLLAGEPTFTSCYNYLTGTNTVAESSLFALMHPEAHTTAAVKALVTKDNRVTYNNGQFYFNGAITIPRHLQNKLAALVRAGKPVSDVLSFLELLLTNPNFDVVNRLFDFMEAGNLSINKDGRFIGYKIVRHDYKDIYTGTMDNSLGKTVSVDRAAVDPNMDNTCAKGLHMCSKEYLPHYGRDTNDRVILVAVNPGDVVAIPADYNNSKLRTCQYEVIGEITHAKAGLDTIASIEEQLQFDPSNVKGATWSSAYEDDYDTDSCDSACDCNDCCDYDYEIDDDNGYSDEKIELKTTEVAVQVQDTYIPDHFIMSGNAILPATLRHARSGQQLYIRKNGKYIHTDV